MLQLPSRPTDNAIIVKVQPDDTAKHQLGDVIVGSFGLTGALVLGAIVSGTVLAGLWILWRKARRTFDTDAPPSIGSVPIGTGSQPKVEATAEPKVEATAEPKFDERADR
jgi:hypothetical protein